MVIDPLCGDVRLQRKLTCWAAVNGYGKILPGSLRYTKQHVEIAMRQEGFKAFPKGFIIRKVTILLHKVRKPKRRPYFKV